MTESPPAKTSSTSIADGMAQRTVYVVGKVIVGVGLGFFVPNMPVWVTAASVLAMAGWIVSPVKHRPRLGRAALAGMLLGGVVAALPTHVLGLVPTAIATIIIVGQSSHPRRTSVVCVSALGIVLSALAIATGAPLELTTASWAVVLIAVLLGFARYQIRQATRREEELAAEHLAMERERERAATLEERASIARDLHDTLAHSLGALVIQFDALEVLAETGRMADVVERTRQLRLLAADGLVEARRAVDVLRRTETGLVVSAGAVAETVTAYALSARALGARVTTQIEVDGDILISSESARALARAAQEGLTNARKHAPGATLMVGLTTGTTTVELTMVNRMPSTSHKALPVPGGGYGLRGMQERFDRIEDATMSVEACNGIFSIRATAAVE